MTYEKPEMRVVDLMAKEAIAGNCWSDDASGKVDQWIYYPLGESVSKDVWIRFDVNRNCNSADFNALEFHNCTAADTIDGMTYMELLAEYQASSDLKHEAGDSGYVDPKSWL